MPNPGATIGVNGLAGNLGIALAAVLTGLLVQWAGWRAAFALPGLLCIALGLLFARVAPRETHAPARRASAAALTLPARELARMFTIMTVAAISGGLIFNFTTNGNAQLVAERMRGVVDDPATQGTVLALVYALASLAQVAVGRLIDRVALRRLQMAIVLAQAPLLLAAAHAQGWWLAAALLGVMVLTFGSVPFIDATIVRYVDDGMRSRVSGLRLTLSIGVSSIAVWALGPLVKRGGFAMLFTGMAALALLTAIVVAGLPKEPRAKPVPA